MLDARSSLHIGVPALRRCIRGIVSTALAVAVTAMLTPNPVLANHTSSCQDFFQNSHHSGIYLGGAKYRIQADLENQSLDICSLSDDIAGSFAFVNIQGTSSSDIVQIGMGRCKDFTGFSQCSGNMNTVWAWGRGSCGLPKFPSIVNLGGLTAGRIFEVSHSGGYWKGYVSSSVLAQVSDSEICWAPKAATWFGENWDRGDAIGGFATNKFAFTFLRYANSDNGGWLSPNLNASNACSINAGAPYLCDITASDAFTIWTAR